MNVLSLFDGMSCGQIALNRSGFKIDNYFASEIDKYAIKVTMANFPNTVQLGSVVDVNAYDLPKIDLLIGGSPCQSFSFAGKRKGMSTKDNVQILELNHYLQLKEEGYEFEGQSYLFWEYMRILNELRTKNPNVYFLLENVEMGEKWEKVLSKAIGVNGIHINSSLVSAQNRKRIYWTNIGMQPSGLFGDLESIIQQPKDKGILLKHILEKDVNEKYFLSSKMMNYLETRKNNFNNGKINYKEGNEKAACINAHSGSLDISDNIIIHNTNTVEIFNNKRLNENIEKHFDSLEHGVLLDSYNKSIHTEKSIAIIQTINSANNTHIVDENAVEIVCGQMGFEKNFEENSKAQTLLQRDYKGMSNFGINVVVHMEKKALNENQLKKFNPNINADKANTLTLAQSRAGSSEEYMDAVSKIAKITSKIRRLTPIECERLQTVPDDYTNHVSDSQRYRMLGNGWTVDVIVHILNYMK